MHVIMCMTADEQMPCRRFKLNMQCKLFRFHMNPCIAAANVLLEKACMDSLNAEICISCGRMEATSHFSYGVSKCTYCTYNLPSK